MTGPYVPAVDRDGNEWWLHVESGEPWRYVPDGATATPGLRRLYVVAEPAPFEHSDMCEDGDDGEPPEDMLHIDPHDGGCLCTCRQCSDAEGGFCICPACSLPPTHPHRPEAQS